MGLLLDDCGAEVHPVSAFCCAGYGRPYSSDARADARMRSSAIWPLGKLHATAVRMKPLQPLRIADIGLASGRVLGIARIDDEHSKTTGVEEFESESSRRWSTP